MKKIYRVGMRMIEDGYVEVEAKNAREALENAYTENENGGFVGYNSRAEIGKILETREI